jgi:hypothetical protein
MISEVDPTLRWATRSSTDRHQTHPHGRSCRGGRVVAYTHSPGAHRGSEKGASTKAACAGSRSLHAYGVGVAPAGDGAVDDRRARREPARDGDVGATAVTDTSALLVLTGLSFSVRKAGSLGAEGAEIAIGLVALGLWTLLALPRIAHWPVRLPGRRDARHHAPRRQARRVPRPTAR